MTELRQTVTVKDAEIVELKETIESLKQKNQESSTTVNEIESKSGFLFLVEFELDCLYIDQRK